MSFVLTIKLDRFFFEPKNHCETHFSFENWEKRVFHDEKKKITQNEKEPRQIDVSNVNNGIKRITKCLKIIIKFDLNCFLSSKCFEDSSKVF